MFIKTATTVYSGDQYLLGLCKLEMVVNDHIKGGPQEF